mmetsp:Transcript_6791/g.20105  ORF Transcript_6791/g.20105 Transcript_6791/m.20105 type:complete len:232 (-) Transcript_6791:11-706(-)
MQDSATAHIPENDESIRLDTGLRPATHTCASTRRWLPLPLAQSAYQAHSGCSACRSRSMRPTLGEEHILLWLIEGETPTLRSRLRGLTGVVRREPHKHAKCARSVDRHEMHLELQRGVGRDHTARAPLAVTEVGCHFQNGLLTNAHLHHAFVPSADHLADPDRELKRAAPLVARVELGAVRDKRAPIVHRELVAFLREVCAVARLRGGLCHAHRKWWVGWSGGAGGRRKLP